MTRHFRFVVINPSEALILTAPNYFGSIDYSTLDFSVSTSNDHLSGQNRVYTWDQLLDRIKELTQAMSQAVEDLWKDPSLFLNEVVDITEAIKVYSALLQIMGNSDEVILVNYS